MKFLTPSRDKEFSKLPATPTSMPLKRNITNKLRIKRTKFELLEELWPMEDLFTIHQLLLNMPALPKKKKPKTQFLSLHLNHTNKKLIPLRKFLTPLKDKESLKPPATPTSLPLKRNITNKLRIKRTKLELPEELWPMEDLFMIHQLLPNMLLLLRLKLNQQLKPRKKPQMRAERSSKLTSKRPQLLLKLKTLKRTPEPLKLPKWITKT